MMEEFTKLCRMGVMHLSSLSINHSTTAPTSSFSCFMRPLWVTQAHLHISSVKGYTGISLKAHLIMKPVVLCRGSCTWTPEVSSSSWMWQTVLSMETPVRSVSCPGTLTVTGSTPAAAPWHSKTSQLYPTHLIQIHKPGPAEAISKSYGLQ